MSSYPYATTANLRTKTLDFRGFHSSILLILRGGILRPKGDFPESLSQAILAGIILVGRLGVLIRGFQCPPFHTYMYIYIYIYIHV